LKKSALKPFFIPPYVGNFLLSFMTFEKIIFSKKNPINERVIKISDFLSKKVVDLSRIKMSIIGRYKKSKNTIYSIHF
jgi:hypothetical protein